GVTGNTLTLATDASEADGNDTTGGDEHGGIIDPTGSPQVSDLRLRGELAVGKALDAQYTFAANGGNTQDKSTYAWGDKGSTAANVSAGQTIETSGTVPSYTLVNADVGKVKEVSVQAKNGQAVEGNTVTLATDASKEDGNDTNGGDNGGGEHGGQVIDPAAQPKISTLTLKGTLVVGQALSATYDFDANRGDGKDASRYAWGDKGNTAANVSAGQTITTTGEIPSYTLVAADVGKVKEVSALAENGLGVTGNTLTLATDSSKDDGNETNGGNDGKIAIAVDNITVVSSRTKAKVGETISLNILVKDKDNNPVPNAAITVNALRANDRQGRSEIPSVRVGANLAHSDKDGRLSVNLTDPNGKGVQTTIRVTAGDTDHQVSKDVNVIFTVITSPDSPYANYYGHMAESTTSTQGTYPATFWRPKLVGEANTGPTNSIVTVNNERWAAVRTGTDGDPICNSHSLVVPPSYVQSPGVASLNSIDTAKLGWPSASYYAAWGGRGGILLCSDDALRVTPYYGGHW
ncbi:Immunoglobulin-like domain BIg-containing protein, partial [Providencia manganoxydans]